MLRRLALPAAATARRTAAATPMVLCQPARLSSTLGHITPPGASMAQQKHQQSHQAQPPQGSIKDRYPPRRYDADEPRRRLAVLVDGSMISAETFAKVLPGIEAAAGVPIVTRIFDTELRAGWQELVVSNAVEWFRVERFIPVHMQLGADAAHLARYKHLNMVQGLAVVCTASEKGYYEQFYERRGLRGVNVYCFDSEGEHSMRDADGRPGNGGQ